MLKKNTDPVCSRLLCLAWMWIECFRIIPDSLMVCIFKCDACCSWFELTITIWSLLTFPHRLTNSNWKHVAILAAESVIASERAHMKTVSPAFYFPYKAPLSHPSSPKSWTGCMLSQVTHNLDSWVYVGFINPLAANPELYSSHEFVPISATMSHTRVAWFSALSAAKDASRLSV